MKAAIDIGSNTARMLVGDISNGRIVPQCYFRHVTRLGGGYDPLTGISAEAGERTLSALKSYAQELEKILPTRTRVVATEAVRRAVNAQEFIANVFNRTGLTVEIIDGEEEAALSSAGVLAALQPVPSVALIFDIGGGSTEFIAVKEGERLWAKSYPLGVVSLTEVTAPELYIENILAELTDDLRMVGLLLLLATGECELVGTAGTVTSLAALDLAMTDYDWQRINNYILPQASLYSLYAKLLPMAPSDRERLPGLEKGRGDLIVHGASIILSLMNLFHKDRLRVSDFGLLEGTLLSIR